MNSLIFIGGLVLSVSMVSSIAIPNPFNHIHVSPMTTGNSLLTPFTHVSSPIHASTVSSQWPSNYAQASSIFPSSVSTSHAFDSTHMGATGATPQLESSMVQRFELIPGQGLTPAVTYFLPTGKCPKNYYCRAEMTIYKEFTGATAIAVGYSVWHFVDPNGPIPSSALKRIMATTNSELQRYLSILTHATYPDYPYRNDLCRYDFGVGIAEFRNVVNEMSACTSVTDGVCRKTNVVKRC